MVGTVGWVVGVVGGGPLPSRFGLKVLIRCWLGLDLGPGWVRMSRRLVCCSCKILKRLGLLVKRKGPAWAGLFTLYFYFTKLRGIDWQVFGVD